LRERVKAQKCWASLLFLPLFTAMFAEEVVHRIQMPASKLMPGGIKESSVVHVQLWLDEKSSKLTVHLTAPLQPRLDQLAVVFFNYTLRSCTKHVLWVFKWPADSLRAGTESRLVATTGDKIVNFQHLCIAGERSTATPAGSPTTCCPQWL
jgi:hypothetical protein